MKKLTSTLIAAGVISGAAMSAPAMAEGPSGNVSIVSDYVWRGVTQTGNQPTVQGGMDWEMDKLSLGVWGSGLDIGGTEFDLYGAYNFGPVSVGAIYYMFYAGGSSSSTYEVNVGGDVGPVSLMASYDPDASAYYLEGGYSYEVSKGVSLDLHLGYGDSYTTTSGGTALDYSIGLSGGYGGVDLALAYAKSDAAADSDGKVFVTVGKSM
jgi:uncharacterized protein (TIGR02001 family)